MKIFKYLNNLQLLRSVLLAHLGRFLSDEQYISLKWRNCMGYKLDLKSPQTFNEKLQWLKLYDRDPLYTKLVDKFEVKDFISDKIGEEYVIPTIGVWDNVESIDWNKLPDQFVLKCTHDSGGLVICRDKNTLDIKQAKKKLSKSMSFDFYKAGREWPYKNVRRRIIAEKYMEDETGELRDYKLFCFNGKVKALFIATGRSKGSHNVKFDFFDDNFNHLPFTNGHPNADELPQKPQEFMKMKQLAEVLAEGIPHVRVDFYEVRNQIYFGEMTFYHWSGMVPFKPKEWDYIFGSWLKLPSEQNY